MSTTKPYLDMRGRAKDGMGNVIITLSHNRTTTSFATGIRIAQTDWNGKNVINRADSAILNAEIEKQKNKIDTRIAVLRLEQDVDNMTAPEIKKAIDTAKPKVRREKHGIVDVFNEYLEQPLSDGTKMLYDVTLKWVLNYGGTGLKIEDINYKWVVGFENYLSKTLSVNSRSVYMRSLRAICNYSVKTNLVKEYAFRNFSVKQEPTRNRNIPVEQLRELYYFPCKPYQEIYRDYFFLMFFLIGINAKDLFLAPPDAIQNGRFEYIRAKTKKRYSIKIEPEAADLLQKYRGKDYLVEVMDRCKDYKNFVHEMDKILRLIGPETEEMFPAENLFDEPKKCVEVQPIIPKITTYFSRHTWATLAHDIGISIDTISQALGHSMGNRTTLVYIKPNQEKVDAANRAVIDYLFKKD